jgi:hypothetical protein
MLFANSKLDLTKRPQISFGQLASFHITGKKQNKFLPRAELGICVGPAVDSHSAVRAYIFHNKQICIRNRFTILDHPPTNFRWKLKAHLTADYNGVLDRIFQPILQNYVEDSAQFPSLPRRRR